MNWPDRIACYVAITGFPQSLFLAADGRVVGTWIMGNNYHVKTNLYGGYPPTYLRRIRALFPDKKRTLHLFSGKVNLDDFPGDTVDCNMLFNPTYCCDAHDLSAVPLESYDLVLADPPYSVEDAEHYGAAMINRSIVMRQLARLPENAHVVWLDQVLPMWRKTEFALEAVIGMVKSTNHRFRVIVISRRLPSPPNPA